MTHKVLSIGPAMDAKKYVEAIGLGRVRKWEGTPYPSTDLVEVQFEDMNEGEMKRQYKKFVDRLSEVDRMLKAFRDMMAKYPADPQKPTGPGMDSLIVTGQVGSYLEARKQNKIQIVQSKDNSEEFSEFSLQTIENYLSSVKSSVDKLQDENVKVMQAENEILQELKLLEFAEKAVPKNTSDDLKEGLLIVSAIGAVADTQKMTLLRRKVWKASGGKALLQSTGPGQNNVSDFSVADPKNPAQQLQKTAFCVYVTGDSLRERLKRLIAADATLYEWPGDKEKVKLRKKELEDRKEDQKQAVESCSQVLHAELGVLTGTMTVLNESGSPIEMKMNSLIEDFRLFSRQEKAVYGILNRFEQSDVTMRCRIWVPTCYMDYLESCLKDCHEELSKQQGDHSYVLLDEEAPKGSTIPTYCRINDFTAPWQTVIDTYGCPNYKTANPAVITSITFPFIFGLMYGDIGHGTCLFCVGLLLAYMGPKNPYALGGLVNWARYMLVQMGFFAIFAGFMYNDLFGIVSLPIFESRFHMTPDANGALQPLESFDSKNMRADSEGGAFDSGPYPFGLDYAWHGSSNELLYTNSLKMKLSVLFGVMQMLMGVGLKFANSIHNKNAVDLFCECIPMLIFMVCFFGYMDYLILYKWTHVIGGWNPGELANETFSDAQGGTKTLGSYAAADAYSSDFAWTGKPGEGSNGPPGIINSLICMAMGQTDFQPMFEGAGEMASTMMLAAIVSVPWILLPKPLILLWRNNAKEKAKAAHAAAKVAAEQDGSKDLESEQEDEDDAGGHGHGGKFDFSEILIHQIIETIEYVLGTVSHTASYLRIWALSLAHQQLSLVFYSKTMKMGIGNPDPVMAAVILYFAFAAWFGITCGVLLAMDVLECFLHTLRLHWVEFQSKFYGGNNEGLKLGAFHIKAVLLED